MKNKKILLINPPNYLSEDSRSPVMLPLNLLYLASSVKNNNFDVDILDFNIITAATSSNEQIIFDKIEDTKPDYVGFSCMFSGQFKFINYCASEIKNKYSNIKTIIGGMHPTIYTFEILDNCKSIDYIVIGEGEQTLILLLTSLNANLDVKGIDGLAYRNNDKVIVNEKTNFIKDINEIKFPDYSLVNIEDYYVDTKGWINPKKLSFNIMPPIVSSRSCPMQCSFCSMFLVMGKKIRKRMATNFVDEVEFLYNEFGINRFAFMDDNLTIDKNHVMTICEEILKRKLNIQFETPNGISAKFLDYEMLDAMVKSGLVRTSLALESGSEFIRNKVIGKRLSNEKIMKTISLTKQFPSLFVRTFFMMGMPEETIETLDDTYNMIKAIDVDQVVLFNVLPFPGTKLFKQVLKDNLLIDEIDVTQLWNYSNLYLTKNKKFFIKPYNMSIGELVKYREKLDNLIEGIEIKRNEKK